MRYANVYEQIKKEHPSATALKEPPEKKHWLRVPLLFCVLPGLFLLAFLVLRNFRSVMDFLVFRVTTPFKHFLSAYISAIPFALAEAVWAVAVVGLVLFLLRTLFLLVFRKGRLKRLLRRFLALVSAGLIVYSCYTVMWGINYYAESFASRSGLTPRGCTAEELYELTAEFAQLCSETAESMPRNEAGNVVLENEALFQNAQLLYSGIAQEFPELNGPVFDPKPMFFSKILSMMGFTGFYFPMTAESLVNVDQPDCFIPSTILHELAHQCNVAEEDAANFVAILAGLRCDDPVFRYSSALMGYIHLSNALYSADRTLWEQASALLSEAVRTDLRENSEFWEKNESPVSTVSETIYEGYLATVGHSEGMKSYGMCVDLLAAYYLDK